MSRPTQTGRLLTARGRGAAPTTTGSGRVVIDIPAEGDATIHATTHRGTPFEVTAETTVTADQARQMCATIADLLER